MIDQSGIDRRRTAHRVDGVLMEDLQIIARIETRQHHRGRPHEDGIIQVGDGAHGMEPGDHIDGHKMKAVTVAVLRSQIFRDGVSKGGGVPVHHLGDVDDGIVMGDHGPLRQSRGAAGIA